MTQERKPLLADFPPADLENWRREVERLLKGAPFARKMFTSTPEGITVGPMYTAKDTQDLPWQNHYPGQAPFVRGTRAGGYRVRAWQVAQELIYPTVEEFNSALRHDLARGQDIAGIQLDLATKLGRDPDQAEPGTVGRGGTSLASLDELEQALDGVDLEATPISIQAGSSALPMAALLEALFKRQGKEISRLHGSLGGDPVYGLASTGLLPVEMDQLYHELAILTRWALDKGTPVGTLPISEMPWHQGGADSSLGLGLTLATAAHLLRAMEKQGLHPEEVVDRIRFRMVVGTDFFMEMAKLRALRLLWSDMVAACGCSPDLGRARIHAQTSPRCLSAIDPHVNMLRATTMGMSAVLGGVDSLQISPFDAVDSIPDDFSRRIARNIQLMLREECRFDQVADPAGGSWYVDKLTAELAGKAWRVFQEIEQDGGVVAGLRLGAIQKRIAEQAAARQERLATGRDVLVGATKYTNPDERARKPRLPDFESLHDARSAAMARQRTAAAHEDHLIVLRRLEKIMATESSELMAALVEAAGQGATIGELTGILRQDADKQLQVEAIPLRRDTEPFEKLRQSIARAAAKDPALGKVFCACLGDFARYMPRLDFIRGFFQVGGFEILGDGFFTTASEAKAAAQDLQPATVVLVGLDETYENLVPETARKLKALSRKPRVLVAGKPGAKEAEFREAGVDGFIHVRSHILDELNSLVRNPEVGE